MCVPVAITSFALYQTSLADMSMTFKVIYLFVVYILWGSFLYTSINIPYGFMASAISPEPGERQSLSMYRSIGATIPSSKEAKQDNNVLTMLKNAVTNKTLISIIVVSILMLLAQMTLQSMANYVFPIYYGNTTAQSISMVVMLVGSLAIATVAKPISIRFGKAEVAVVSSFIVSAICVVLFAIGPQNVWVYVAF